MWHALAACCRRAGRPMGFQVWMRLTCCCCCSPPWLAACCSASGGTPSKARQGSLASAGGSIKPAAKEQGRFKVYEGDEPPPFR